jgi:UDP-N-acetylmuramoyl-tripeptide--D-alanyl-D-alanine ligase
MGARGVGHVTYLCGIAPPRVAAVLNVGTAHIGEFGSREAIALAKGEIVESLPADGTAVLNADDALVAAMASRTRARVLTFGAGDGAGVRVCDVTLDDLGRPSFELVHLGRGATVHLAQVGTHQWRNAAAAAAMALAVGMDLDTVADELGTATSASRWRMELTERPDGLVVINDAYNANPESMAAAVDTLATIGSRTGRRSIAVLGEMFELGEDTEAGHARAGRAAAQAGVDVVLSVGRQAEAVARAFADQGSGEAVVTGTRDEALTWLRHNVSAADVVLVKASRGAALEVIADHLLAEGNSTR